MMIECDTVSCSDCTEFMRSLPDGSVDLVVTSPPYAQQRKETYGGIPADEYADWIVGICQEVYRILKPSGSFVLNIKENVVSGARQRYVYETVLRLADIFVWNDTYIWNKANPYPTGSKRRLKDGFEYCFLFTKSGDYKFNVDSVLVKSTSKWLESEKRRKNTGAHPTANGSGMGMHKRYANDMVRPSNVLTLAVDCTNHKHPATFPIALPSFFIKLLTDEGDIVYDPFMGSGTTCVAAKQLGRHFIGTDISQEYCEIARERIAAE